MGGQLASLFSRAGLPLAQVADDASIPGTFWGAPEAGLKDGVLWFRADTPVHSVLHEGCHYLCMSPARRAALDTNAGGSVLEECAVCYLQIVLADQLPDVGRERLLSDMDDWGYSFRLGSARAWFEDDAHDARQWLSTHGLIDADGRVRLVARGAA